MSAEPRRSTVAGSGTGDSAIVLQERDRQDGGNHDDSEQAKAIRVAHNHRLDPDRVANEDGSATPCSVGSGNLHIMKYCSNSASRPRVADCSNDTCESTTKD
jgi:hypothetical protein